MKAITRVPQKMSEQMVSKIKKNGNGTTKKKDAEGDFGQHVSTGSTLLDLAISGNRVRGGGLPKGILVEAFGPSGSGKTVLLSSIAGSIQRNGGQIQFCDPEARLNKQFARIFGLDSTNMTYQKPNTVTEVFAPIRDWEPEPADGMHGVFADSLAALSTDMEMEGKDQMGMRRAKEFSEQLRITCRELERKGFLMVCSNQVRQNLDAGAYGSKYKTPGGEALAFYASVRLRFSSTEKIKKKITVKGKELTRIIGVNTEVEVYKNSVDAPYRTAPLIIQFDYGIDDIRANLQFLKSTNGWSKYKLGDQDLGISMDGAIKTIEDESMEMQLRDAVIDLWEEVEAKFVIPRKARF